MSSINMKNHLKKLCILLICSLGIISCDKYEIKDGKVYYRTYQIGRGGYNTYLIEDADSTTFEVVDNNIDIPLAKDKNSIFLRSSKIVNSDPGTFQQIKKYYWKDKNQVYLFVAGGYSIKDADPETFSPISFYWGADKNSIFHYYEKLDNANLDHFSVINEYYAKDDKFYYYRSQKIENLDYKTAEVINNYYIKDKDYVYYLAGKKLENANPNKFEPRGVGSFGDDGTFHFSGEKNKGYITEEYRKTYIDTKK